MSILSYAQNFEDVLLARAFPAPVGFYIDVGAADPVSHSVTKLFYERGWRGVNVEPHAGFFNRLTADRPRDVNLNAAVTDASGRVDYYEVPTNIGWATVSHSQVERLTAQGLAAPPRSVAAVTLNDVWDAHVTGTVDFLKVDVEGAEREVLRGLDLGRRRPRVILLEAIEPGTNQPNHDEWEHLLLDRDYLFAHFDGVNRYYARAEDRDLLPALLPPVSCLDQAVRFEDVERVRQVEVLLRATEEELRAARRERDASAEQARETADRLRASDDRLRASDDRLRATAEQVQLTTARYHAAVERFRQLRMATVSRKAYDTLKRFLDRTREHVTTLHNATFAHPPPPPPGDT